MIFSVDLSADKTDSEDEQSPLAQPLALSLLADSLSHAEHSEIQDDDLEIISTRSTAVGAFIPLLDAKYLADEKARVRRLLLSDGTPKSLLDEEYLVNAQKSAHASLEPQRTRAAQLCQDLLSHFRGVTNHEPFSGYLDVDTVELDELSAVKGELYSLIADTLHQYMIATPGLRLPFTITHEIDKAVKKKQEFNCLIDSMLCSLIGHPLDVTMRTVLRLLALCCALLEYAQSVYDRKKAKERGPMHLRDVINNNTASNEFMDIREAHSLNKYILHTPLLFFKPSPNDNKLSMYLSLPSTPASDALPLRPVSYFLLHANHFSPVGCGSESLNTFVARLQTNFLKSVSELQHPDCEASKLLINTVRTALHEMEALAQLRDGALLRGVTRSIAGETAKKLKLASTVFDLLSTEVTYGKGQAQTVSTVGVDDSKKAFDEIYAELAAYGAGKSEDPTRFPLSRSPDKKPTLNH